MARRRAVVLTWLMLLCCVLAPSATLAQSNYDQVENSIEFPNPDKGLPESTVLDGKVTKLDELSPVIFLNRTKAALNCAAGFMQIELKFEEPFYGRAYADFDRSSACMVTGKGNNTARIDLPLRGCGTKQDPLRVFTNNIVIRFHPFLEMDGDEVVTIVCRYPPPIAPPPAGIPNKIIDLPSTPLEPPLKGFQILLIVCGILFLSLVLLGLGCSYYCLRNQQVQVIRRHPLSSVGSDKLSDSSLSMFDGLKIPRARAPTLDSSSSGSEMALVSAGDTLPSDYPSESPSSEPDDADGRSLRRSPSSGGSYENRAFQQQEEYVAERYQRESPLPPPVQPKFDVQLRVKRAPPPAPSPTPPPSESEASVTALERNLTTILERDETTATITEERYRQAPVYSTVVRKDRDETEWYRQEETVTAAAEKRRKSPPPPPPVQPPPQMYRTETESDRYMSETRLEVFEPPVVPTKRPEITSHTVDDVFLKTITEKKTIEDVERHRREVVEYKPKPLPPPASWDVTIKNYPNPDAQYPQSGEDTATDWDSYSEASSVTGYLPPPPPPPQSSQHQSPLQSRSPPHSSAQTSRIHSYTHQQQQQQQYSSTVADELHRWYLTTVDVPVSKPDNWESLVRVLEVDEPEPEPEHRYRVEQTLTLDDKRKWRRIITTESTLRRLITEATVREDFERIRNDPVHGSAFEPDKWDVIIRVIAPPPQQQQQQHYDQKAGAGPSGGNRYTQKKKTTTEFEGTRTRRNSLPTVYEYDSDDDGSSVRTLTAIDDHGPLGPGARSRRTSRSSFKSDMDVRSMSEMTVDFRRPDVPDNYSDVSSAYNYYYQQQQHQHHHPQHQSNRRGYYADDDAGSLVRSLSQPSLARSASEFTENWGVRLRSYEDGDDLSSNSSSAADRTPRSSFREQGRPRRQYQQQQQQQQQYQQYEQQYSSVTGSGTRRTMFGGPTVSAAEWFHDADDRDTGYHQ